MRIQRIILILFVLLVCGFGYVWTVDGGGDFITCVPLFLAGLTAQATHLEVTFLRRVLIPLYLLLFVVSVWYSVERKRGWLQALWVLVALHFVFVVGIMLQDD